MKTLKREVAPDILAKLKEYEDSLPNSRVPCGDLLFSYGSTENQLHARQLLRGTQWHVKTEKVALKPTFMIHSALIDGERFIEFVGTAREFLMRVEQSQATLATEGQHERLNLLKGMVRADMESIENGKVTDA